MACKKIYLIRHGETDFNKKGIVQGGGVDSDLNDTGRFQADAFFKKYKSVSFDKIYTSVLKRSIQSVKPFNDLGIAHETHPGLNEINWGHREGTEITPEENQYYLETLQRWREGETALRIEGGECPEDVRSRQKPVLDLILSRENESNILICMHGRAMRIFLCLLLNYELRFMDIFTHHNLCLYQLNYNNGLFSIEAFDDRGHLQ